MGPFSLAKNMARGKVGITLGAKIPAIDFEATDGISRVNPEYADCTFACFVWSDKQKGLSANPPGGRASLAKATNPCSPNLAPIRGRAMVHIQDSGYHHAS